MTIAQPPTTPLPPLSPLSPTHRHPATDHKLPSLLEDPAPPAGAAPTARAHAHASASRDALRTLGATVRRHKRLAMALAAVLVIGAGIGLYFALRPMPQPDFLDDDLDLVLNFAWLNDDFNNLPVKERLALIADMIERMKNMTSGDSAMMAMFATTLEEKARKQLMKNVSHMAIDVWDEYAKKYDGVPTDGRGDYLDDTFLEFTKMMETLAGEQSKKSDEERLADVRKQADRDRKAVESGKFNPPAQALGRVFEFMNFEVGGNASPQQRSRGQLMMRDMMRHFRGDDVNAEPAPAAPAPGDAPAKDEKPAEKPAEKPPEPGPR